MKFFIFIALLLPSLALSSNEVTYHQALAKVLKARESKSLLTIAQRLERKVQEIDNELAREVTKESLKRLGYVEGKLGICKIELEFQLTDGKKLATCIQGERITRFYP